MDWTIFSTVTGTGLTLLISLFTLFGFLFGEMKRIEDRLDAKNEILAARSDKLYEMFIDLLKEKKDRK